MEIEIITRRGCSACEQTKRILTNHNIAYRETVIEEDVQRSDVVARFPDRKKLPIILVNSSIVEGPKELQLLLERDQLGHVA